MGVWNITRADEGVQNNFSFFVYGSGPRTEWEWVADLILIVIVIACCYDIVPIMVRKTTRGPWLNPQGMMLTANASGESGKAVANCSGIARDAETRFVVRDMGPKEDGDDG